MSSINIALGGDARELARLAALDSADELRAPVVTASVDGRVRAALSLADGRVVADPFVPTAGLVELLVVHARRIAA
jgi:hypothetical protein